MANKKRQQTINKRNRERAVEEKRTLKRERKQAQREPFELDSTGQPIELDSPAADEATGDSESDTENLERA
jgi:hypothetical protein